MIRVPMLLRAATRRRTRVTHRRATHTLLSSSLSALPSSFSLSLSSSSSSSRHFATWWWQSSSSPVTSSSAELSSIAVPATTTHPRGGRIAGVAAVGAASSSDAAAKAAAAATSAASASTTDAGDAAATTATVVGDVADASFAGVRHLGPVDPALPPRPEIVYELPEVTADDVGEPAFVLIRGMTQYLEHLHAWCGCPWWASIALAAVSIRVAIIPLVVWGMHNNARIAMLRPYFELNSTLFRQSDEPIWRRRRLYISNFVTIFRTFRVNPLISILPIVVSLPAFVSFAFAARGMVSSNTEFATGGTAWFVNLAEADATMVLPLTAVALTYTSLHLNTRASKALIRDAEELTLDDFDRNTAQILPRAMRRRLRALQDRADAHAAAATKAAAAATAAADKADEAVAVNGDAGSPSASTSRDDVVDKTAAAATTPSTPPAPPPSLMTRLVVGVTNCVQMVLIMALPVTVQFPSGIFMYWIPSAAWGMAQSAATQNAAVRDWFMRHVTPLDGMSDNSSSGGGGGGGGGGGTRTPPVGDAHTLQFDAMVAAAAARSSVASSSPTTSQQQASSSSSSPTTSSSSSSSSSSSRRVPVQGASHTVPTLSAKLAMRDRLVSTTKTVASGGGGVGSRRGGGGDGSGDGRDTDTLAREGSVRPS